MKPGLACYWLWGVHKKSLLSKVREAKVEDAHCGLTLVHVSVEFPSERPQPQALRLHLRPILDEERVEAKTAFSPCSLRSCHVCRAVSSFPSINCFSFCCDGISDRSNFSNSSLASQLEKRISNAHEWGGETQGLNLASCDCEAGPVHNKCVHMHGCVSVWHMPVRPEINVGYCSLVRSLCSRCG